MSTWNRDYSKFNPSQAELEGQRHKNNHFTEMCSGSEAGSYFRLIDSCITQLKAQGPSRTCNESTEEEEEEEVSDIECIAVKVLNPTYIRPTLRSKAF